MIVVAIIGILAAIAIPQYQNYSIRARVTEGLVLAGAAKLAVIESIASMLGTPIAGYSGTGAAGGGSYGYEFTPTKDVASIGIAAAAASPLQGDSRISVTYSANFPAPGMVVRLTPGSNGAGMPIFWACDVNAVAAYFKYVPANCRS